MYRQIKVAEEDQCYQKILWRFSSNEPIKEYKLTTVTYGTAPAPYLAIRTIHQLAKDEKLNYPFASKILLTDFYVDDVMSGGNDLEEVKQIQRQLLQLLSSGGFSLRKWTSNSHDLLTEIPSDKREKGILEINDEDTIKTLGVHWSPKMDHFQFKVRVPNATITKRTLLSDIARIFDPLGWLTPITVKAKLMLQELWLNKLDWDDSLPSNILTKWQLYRNELQLLEQIIIPRWIQYEPVCNKIELHGFCDASEKAYAAVVYSRVTTRTGRVFTYLLTAKSKVAPIKSKLTIPKLELCGATLLARLIEHTKTSLDIGDIQTTLWIDSKICLDWIKASPRKWETFVTNRVSQIQELTNPNQWRHVSTDNNPADCASRGIYPGRLKAHPLWWFGPHWLKYPEHQWPQTPKDPSTTLEVRQLEVAVLTAATNTTFIERFSTLKRLIRVIAYCYRFSEACKKLTSKPSSIMLTAVEIKRAEKQIIRMVQKEHFSEDIAKLTKGENLLPKTKLAKFNPFIDSDGILRIGGRLENSILTYSEKHPIILPRNSHYTMLVINNAHINALHSGTTNTLAYIRRTYWILDGRNAVGKYINTCIKCIRFKARTAEQQMGNLPSARVTPSRPFTHTGVDYAGPLQIRASKGRGIKSHKGYLAIFVCMATKAVHVEIVSDLTTEAFLASFKRFTARRGLSAHIYSDCGTNFVGARRILDENLQMAIRNSEQHVADLIVTDGIQWHFNPPASPHFGGLWEASVKSIKYHLKRVIGEMTLTFEELATVLCQIEACLNSRPLCPLSNDPDELNVLTPGHFLIGDALICPPNPHTADEKISLLRRWRLVDKISRDIWKSWSKEYLTYLQQRTKWKSSHTNIQNGELVLIKNEQLPPGKWLLGRVNEIHPGTDGKVRVVSVRCKGNTTLKRPITKICRLPIEEAQHNETNLTDRGHTPSQVYLTLTKNTSVSTFSERKRLRLSFPQQSDGRYDCCPTKKRRINPVTGYSGLIRYEQQRELKLKYKLSDPQTKFTHTTTKKYQHKLESRPDEEPRNKKRLTLTEYKNRRLEQASTFLTCLILLFLIKLGHCGYSISHPKPGIYIEHMGETKIRRGTLRVELNYPLNTTTDILRINNTITQMTNLCERSKGHPNDVHCEILLHHLQEKQQSLLRDIEILDNQRPERTKRGVFGGILQYIFGVNDEVYADIDGLKKNQQILIQTNQHQTNLMLSTVAQVKDSENKTINKLRALTDKLNLAILEISKMEQWFSSVDVNRVNIHILSAYQMAASILDELEERYTTFIKTTLHRGNLLNILTPGELAHLIYTASQKIPPNLSIFRQPMDRIESNINETHINIFGYLHITAVTTYDVVKITPIPKKLSDGKFVVPELHRTIIAADYNSQTYFESSEEEWEHCLKLDKYLFLCSPNVLSRIDSNSNCMIDEIYQRHEKHQCVLKEVQIPNTLFKHLYKANSWLFITNTPTPAAIICNGIHEDIIFNSTGIIQIDQGCIIKTKKNILNSETSDKITVKATFIKPLEFNLSLMEPTKFPSPFHWEAEPVLKASDQLSSIIHGETALQNQLVSHHWKTIGNHMATGAITLLISIIALATAYRWHLYRKQVTTQENKMSSSVIYAEPHPARRNLNSSKPRIDFNLQQFEITPSATSIAESENVCT